MSKSIKFISVILSVMLVFSSAFVAEAKSVSEYEKEKDRIEQNLKKSEKELSALKKKKGSMEEYVKVLQGKITLLQDRVSSIEKQKAALQTEINAIEEKIKKTIGEIEEFKKEIEVKQKEFEKIYDVYCQRLRAMYISGHVSTLEVLLDSEDMSSILTRAEMVKSVSAQDSETLDKLMTKMKEIQKQKQALQDKKDELDKDKENLDSRKSKLQASIDEINKSKSELKSEISECNSAIVELSKTSNSIMEKIDEDQDKINQLEDEIKNASNSGGSNSGSHNPGTGVLGYPTNYRSISAGYPNYPSGRYHGGVDFPCPVGTNVYASDSGTVAMVKYLNYSYGFHILINHGNGLSTLYAHNSKILVSVGQNVSKGQKIAESGETGNATGPHCHFEVRLNGNRVNPMNYLR